VTELEEENNCLRTALNLPPANRPALGKGPTGKDKPKSSSSGSRLRTLDSPAHDSSDPASPSSTGTGSNSPSTMNANNPRASTHAVDGPRWDQPLLMDNEKTYLPSISTPTPQKPMQHYTYPIPLPPTSSRIATSTPLYISTPQATHTTDRSMGNAYGNFVLRDSRGQQQQSPHSQQYPYPSHTFSTAHDCTVQAHHATNPNASTLGSFPHRRSLTEPQTLRSLNHFPHLPGLPPTHRSQD
jgi:hypothetical protein